MIAGIAEEQVRLFGRRREQLRLPVGLTNVTSPEAAIRWTFATNYSRRPLEPSREQQAAVRGGCDDLIFNFPTLPQDV